MINIQTNFYLLKIVMGNFDDCPEFDNNFSEILFCIIIALFSPRLLSPFKIVTQYLVNIKSIFKSLLNK